LNGTEDITDEVKEIENKPIPPMSPASKATAVSNNVSPRTLLSGAVVTLPFFSVVQLQLGL